MNFYIGVHYPALARHFERCCISIRILRGNKHRKARQSDFPVRDWILDSGAFKELELNGRYIHSVEEYAEEAKRWSRCGNLEAVVSQDYMCEPFMLEKTGLTIKDHQELTIERYDKLRWAIAIPVMPVLQGFAPAEYAHHITMYRNRLGYGMWVGVGSVCKRNRNPQEIINVLEAIKTVRPDLRLHGFGLKLTALKNTYVCSLIYSADSMAWSYSARRQGRDANSAGEAITFCQRITLESGSKEHQFVMEGM